LLRGQPKRSARATRCPRSLAHLAVGEGAGNQHQRHQPPPSADDATVIAHSQNVPEPAELIAAVAGTKPIWVTTRQTEDGLLTAGPSGRGSRRRGYKYEIHPSVLKRLQTGVCSRDNTGRRTASAAGE
jgi:hypothetical protein